MQSIHTLRSAALRSKLQPRNRRLGLSRSSRTALVLGVLGSAGLAQAREVDAVVTTLVSGRQDARDGSAHTSVPILELVSIRATKLGIPWLDDVKLVVSGWGRVDPADPVDKELATGDVDVASIEGTALGGRLALRAGRQLIIGGAARNAQIDGVRARYKLTRKLGISGYGGHPVTREFEIDRGDAIAGARLFWRQSVNSEAGLSVIHLRKSGVIARQDVAIDGRYRAAKSVVATAYGLWSTTEARLAEVDLAADWQALGNLRLAANYRRIAPDLFLSRSSILSVFSIEHRDEIGATTTYRPMPRVRLLGDYAFVSLEGGQGFRAGAKASVFLGERAQSRLAAALRVFDTPKNRYYRSRLSANHRISPDIALSVDADAYLLDKALNGQTLSLTSVATASYSLSQQWHLTAVGIAGSTPFFKRRIEVMGKLVWGQVRRVREVSP